jgi:hypothetical protein
LMPRKSAIHVFIESFLCNSRGTTPRHIRLKRQSQRHVRPHTAPTPVPVFGH